MNNKFNGADKHTEILQKIESRQLFFCIFELNLSVTTTFIFNITRRMPFIITVMILLFLNTQFTRTVASIFL